MKVVEARGFEPLIPCTQNLITGGGGFVAQIGWWDSCFEPSVIAGCHEQLDTDDLQDPELGGLQPNPKAARIVIHLV